MPAFGSVFGRVFELARDWLLAVVSTLDLALDLVLALVRRGAVLAGEAAWAVRALAGGATFAG